MKKIASVFVILILFSACKTETKNIPNHFDYGTVNNSSYTNSFFNFTFKVNPDWTVLNNEEKTRLTNISIEVFTGDNENLERLLDASQINVAPLFYSFKNPIDQVNTAFNPSIVINAENIKSFPEITTVEQYLDKAKGLINQSAMNVTFSDKVITKDINGKKYGYLQMTNTANGMTINQEYFAVMEQNFIINFIISYDNDDDKKALYNMVNSFSFYKVKGK